MSGKGFAGMSPERQREIARMGGKAVPKEKRSFYTNKDLAKAAGKKGGTNVPAEKRSFAKDPDFASQAGVMGGSTRKRKE